MIVVIYSPNPQSGKTTVGSVLQEFGFTRLSLGDPVKQSLLVVLQGLGTVNPEDYLWGDKKDTIIPELGVTGGYLMSTYATDYMRAICEDVWLNMLKPKLKPFTYIDDMRFENEYRHFDSIGAIKIKLIRPNVSLNGRSGSSEGNLSHLPFDITLYNVGTIEDLIASTRATVQPLLDSIQSQLRGFDTRKFAK